MGDTDFTDLPLTDPWLSFCLDSKQTPNYNNSKLTLLSNALFVRFNEELDKSNKLK
jgi:hypothetical protein